MLGAIELIQLFSVCKQLSILKVLAKDRLVVEKDVEAHLGGLSEKNWESELTQWQGRALWEEADQ